MTRSWWRLMLNRRCRLARRLRPAVERLEDRTQPSFLPAVHYSFGETPGPPMVGDFNNDNYPDVLVSAFSGHRLFLGNGDGTLQPPLLLDQAIRPAEAGDFNGDGRLDLVGSANDSVRVWLGNGDGTFQPAVSSPLGLAPATLAAGDLNGDGVLDVVANFYKIGGFGGIGGTFDGIETGWYVNAWLGNGDGTLRTPVDIRLETQAGGLVAADFNGDGALDAAVPYLGSEYGTPPRSGSRVSVLLGNGDGTFQAPLTQSVFPHARPLSLAAADFNRDGRSDLVLANWEFSWAGTTPVSVLLGNGDGTFQEPLNYDVHRGRQWLAVADFDRDDFPDLVVHSLYSADFSVLINAADWQPPPPAVDLGWSGPLTGPITVVPGEAFTVGRTYVISGSAAPADFSIAYYASADAVFGNEDDLLLAVETVSAGAVGSHSGTSPSLQIGAPGTYYLFARLDATDALAEVDEDNNVAQAAQPLAVTASAGGEADLSWSGGGIVTAASVAAGESFTVGRTFAVGGDPVGPFTIAYWASLDDVFGNEDDFLVGVELVEGAAPGIHSGSSPAFTIAAPGTYFLFAVLDGAGQVGETDEDNNLVMALAPLFVTALGDETVAD